MFTFERLLLIPLVVLYVISPMQAQWSSNPAVNSPVVLDPLGGEAIAIVHDGNNGAIVIFHTNSKPLNAQRINSEGYPVWQSGGVLLCDSTTPKHNITTISDENGGALIAWIEYLTSGENAGGIGVFIQQLDSAGNLPWGSSGKIVSTSGLAYAGPLYIKSDGNQGAFIFWGEERNDSNNVFVQHIDVNGNLLWGQNGVVFSGTDPLMWKVAAGIVSDGNGGIIVTCMEVTAEATYYDYDFSLQHMNAAGNITWPPDGIRIDPLDMNTKFLPDIRLPHGMLPDGNGGAIVLYSRNTGSSRGLFAQRVDSNGVVLWDSTTIPIIVDSDQWGEAGMVEDGENGAIAVWVAPDTTDENHYFATRILPSGEISWKTMINNIGVAQTTFDLRPINGGGICLTWEELSADDTADIFIQYVDNSGTLRWPGFEQPVTTAPGLQEGPRLVITNTNDAIVTWEIDNRRGEDSLGVYAQRISYNALADVDDLIIPREFLLAQNYPNPFNPRTHMQFSIANLQFVSLKVYDVLGREVATLVNEQKMPGTYNVSWDATGMPSGVYFYRLQSGSFFDQKKMLLMK